MRLFGAKRIHKAKLGDIQVDVSEEKGVRSLHLGSATVQSSMKVSAPTELVLEYTRCMMGFLLFCPEPDAILMIGLGGGSTAKWAHHHLPGTRVTVIEINPQVIQIARSLFFVPEDDAHLEVRLDDGAEYIAGREAIADVIQVDGYDGVAVVEQLNSESFYQHCFDALTANGVLVVNLWGNDKYFDAYLQRIERVFNGAVACLPAMTKGNITVFGFKRSQNSPRWSELKERARALEAEYGLEFPVFVSQLMKRNLHTDKRLLI